MTITTKYGISLNEGGSTISDIKKFFSTNPAKAKPLRNPSPPKVSTSSVSNSNNSISNKESKSKYHQYDKRAEVALPYDVDERLREVRGNIMLPVRGLKKRQRLFLYAFVEPFTMDDKGKVTLNPIRKVCHLLKLNPFTIHHWIRRDAEFKAVYSLIVSYRDEAYKELAESQLVQNYLNGKEASLIFYLKNMLPGKYRDDNILNQLFLKTQSINFNMIQTSVSGKSNQQLINLASKLTEELRLHREHAPEEEVEGGRENSRGIDTHPDTSQEETSNQDVVVPEVVLEDLGEEE